MNDHSTPSPPRDFTIPLAVNDAVSRSRELAGTYVYVTGTLRWEFEGQVLEHWPKAEAQGHGVWLDAYGPVFSFDDEVLGRWSGKRVVVGGRVVAPEDRPWGFGHMGSSDAELGVTSLVLWKAWQRDHPPPVSGRVVAEIGRKGSPIFMNTQGGA